MIPNVDLLQSLVSGWIAGAVAGLACTAIWLVAFIRHPELALRLPLQQKLVIFGIVFANAFVISLTLVGIVLGALHYRFGGGPGDGYSLALLGGTVVIALGYAFVRGRIRSQEGPYVLITLATVGVAFGLLMPWLASMDT